MDKLLPEDVAFVASRVPRDVIAVMKANCLYIAGGFVRAAVAGEEISDIDLWGASKADLAVGAATLAALRHTQVSESDNAITVLAPPHLPVQFVHRWLFTDAVQIVESFDFTVAQAVVWNHGAGWHSAIGPRFYPDLAARRLCYTAPIRVEDAGGSLLRVRKFLGKGYRISAPSLAAVVARLTMSGPARCLTTGCTEAAAAEVYTNLLREVDPLTPIDGGTAVIDEHAAGIL